MSGRTWADLRERLSDLASLGEELHGGLEQGQYRFLLAVIAPMATDAGRLACDLETELRNEMAENGVDLPPLDLGAPDMRGGAA
ncbi:hypothetical protein [Streptacidiphilus rugosus]|uniref:hypothetical protein n=1 Tax=Streptacidiphilus rugosus TaxID=405783 RepID=UPI00055E585A|nr:hypothetical protein [Streptacidiphilus rugosus]